MKRISYLLFLFAFVCVNGNNDLVDVENDSVAQESRKQPFELKVPTVYDAYFGKPVSTRRNAFLGTAPNSSVLCTVLVNPCNKDEGRRVDGTCTNPYYPSKGATLTPLLRLLPPMYGAGNTLRPAKDGSELPSARLIRTTVLGDGYFPEYNFSILSTHVFVFSFVDNVDLFHLTRYALGSDCCINNQIPNPVGPFCIPIPVPADDPYLRRTGIRCLNLTREETYQDYGCIPPTLPSARYSRVTPLLDLSVVYGNTDERNQMIRAKEGGLLAFRLEGKREVPAGPDTICPGNRPPETACYNYGDAFHGNALSGIFLTTMWFFREHNRLARELAKINPCWDDEKLFKTARQINIAQWQYIFYYELIAEIMGRDNAIADGIIYEHHHGHVNDFDPHYPPGVYRDYAVAGRYFHTYQPALFDLYRDHEYMGSRTAVDDEFRTGILAINNTEADLTEGSIIQPADGFDKVIDPDLTERIHSNRQAAADLSAIDIMRGRDAGLPPYNHYRKLCGLKVAKHFEDFEDTIDKDKVEQLSRLYDEVDDVELMVAVYLETHPPGMKIGPTLYCIMAHNLLHWRKSDRFFFEQGGHPAALTHDQLHQVKQHSMARILCDNGDGIKAVQPKAMLRRTASNDYVSCEEIPKNDLIVWKDKECVPQKSRPKKNNN